jgi:hypothetical protein
VDAVRMFIACLTNEIEIRSTVVLETMNARRGTLDSY